MEWDIPPGSGDSALETGGTLFIVLVVDTKFPEQRFHIAYILVEVIARLVQALLGHSPNLADDFCVALVIWEPPVLNFGELPDGG